VQSTTHHLKKGKAIVLVSKAMIHFAHDELRLFEEAMFLETDEKVPV
jgi:hypothetical protein